MQLGTAFGGKCELDSVFYVHDLDYHWHIAEHGFFQIPADHAVYSAAVRPIASASEPVDLKHDELRHKVVEQQLEVATLRRSQLNAHVTTDCDGLLQRGVTTVFWDGGCPMCVKEIATNRNGNWIS
jgi:hypothetical protein